MSSTQINKEIAEAVERITDIVTGIESLIEQGYINGDESYVNIFEAKSAIKKYNDHKKELLSFAIWN